MIVGAALAFGDVLHAGMTLLTNAAEHRGLDYGYAFALINLAWAPGQARGSAVGGAVAEATSRRRAVPHCSAGHRARLRLPGCGDPRSSS